MSSRKNKDEKDGDQDEVMLLRVNPSNIIQWKNSFSNYIISKYGKLGRALMDEAIPEDMREDYVFPYPEGVEPENAERWKETDEGGDWKKKRKLWFARREEFHEKKDQVIALMFIHMTEQARQQVKVKRAELQTLRSQSDLLGVWRLITEAHLRRNREISCVEQQNAIEAVRRLKQKEKERIENFIDIFTQKLEICEDMQCELSENFKVHTFLTALYAPVFKERVRMIFQHRNEIEVFPQSFEEVKTLVRDWQAADQAVSRMDTSKHRNQREHRSEGRKKKDENDAQEGGMVHTAKVKETERRDTKGKSKTEQKHCDICEKTNHNTSECYSLQRFLKSDAGRKQIREMNRKKITKVAQERNDEDDDDEEEVDDDEDSGTRFYKTGTAVLKATKKVKDHYTILDSGSNINLVDKQEKISDATPCKKAAIQGITEEDVTPTMKGNLENYGEAFVVPDLPMDIISLSKLSSTHEVNYYHQEGVFVVISSDGQTEYFTLDHDIGLFIRGDKPKDFVESKPESLKLTKVERERAREARRLHEYLGHPNDDALIKFTEVTNNCPVTKRDVTNALKLYGYCPQCRKGKAVEAPAIARQQLPAENPGQIIHADIVYITGVKGRKIPYLICVDERSKFVMASKLSSKEPKELALRLSELKAYFTLHEWTVKELHTDAEAVFRSLKWSAAEMQIALQLMPTNRHERVAERFTRVLRERLRILRNQEHFQIPNSWIPYAVTSIVTNWNLVPTTEQSISPYQIVTGNKVNLDDHLIFPFGQVVQCKENPINDDDPRVSIGVVVGRDNDMKRSIRVIKLNDNKPIVVSRSQVYPLEPSKLIIDKVSEIAKLDGGEIPDVESISDPIAVPRDLPAEDTTRTTSKSKHLNARNHSKTKDKPKQTTSTSAPKPSQSSSKNVPRSVDPKLQERLRSGIHRSRLRRAPKLNRDQQFVYLIRQLATTCNTITIVLLFRCSLLYIMVYIRIIRLYRRI